MNLTPEEIVKKVRLMEPHEHPSVEDILTQQGPDFTLKGKTALVTGGSAGLGVETVKALASAGARVFVAVRDVEKTKKMFEEISKAHPNHSGLEIVQIELDDIESVRKAADDFLSRSSQLNLLILNAGVMGFPQLQTKDGHEYHFGVNHLAHFLLFKKLLPVLLSSSRPTFHSRVVVLSSRGHQRTDVDLTDLDFKKRGYHPSFAYGQSKTANVLMAREIENRYGNQGLHAWSVHPGMVPTELGRYLSLKNFVELGLFNEKGEYISPIRYKSLSQGAATQVWAAVGKDLEGKGGDYLEDCHVAVVIPTATFKDGVVAHAYNNESARKLWDYSEKVVNA